MSFGYHTSKHQSCHAFWFQTSFERRPTLLRSTPPRRPPFISSCAWPKISLHAPTDLTALVGSRLRGLDDALGVVPQRLQMNTGRMILFIRSMNVNGSFFISVVVEQVNAVLNPVPSCVRCPHPSRPNTS